MPPTRQDTPRRSSSATRVGRLEGIRAGLHQVFTGRSSVGSSSPEEGPKTPRLAIGLHNLPSTRLIIPGLTRTVTNHSVRSQTSNRQATSTPSTPLNSGPTTPNSVRQAQQPVSPRLPQFHRSSPTSNDSRFVGVDPAEQHLADLTQAGRRRRRKVGSSEHSCVPKIKNRKIRSKLLSCFVSGIFLTLVLTICMNSQPIFYLQR